jgi:hypothetical protein
MVRLGKARLGYVKLVRLGYIKLVRLGEVRFVAVRLGLLR